jgi:hypothetical protein
MKRMQGNPNTYTSLVKFPGVFAEVGSVLAQMSLEARVLARI